MIHEFTITVGPLDLDDDAFSRLSDALYEAGCDDATVSMSGRMLSVHFSREAGTYQGAVCDALDDVTAGLSEGLGEDESPEMDY